MKKLYQYEKLSYDNLCAILEKYNGHWSLFRFSTHWKAMLGTPNLDSGEGREEVWMLKSYDDLRKCEDWLKEYDHLSADDIQSDQ